MKPILSLIAMVSIGALLSGCSTREKPAPAVSTASLSGHLDRIEDNLSRSDAKAVVIRKWLQSH